MLLFLLQMVAILVVTQVCGWLAQRIRQPQVVGEIVGGLVLGPLVLGRFAPAWSGFLFPAGGLHGLELVSNAAVVVFLFLIGSELNLSAVRAQRWSFVVITAGSIGVPFVLGGSLSLLLVGPFGSGGSRLGFILFVAIAMSITALPVLARILEERRGSMRAVDEATAAMALLCAAANDLAAWMLLAATLTVVHGGGGAQVGVRLAVLAGFIAAMLLLVRRVCARVFALGWPMWVQMAAGVVLALLSARVTEALGVHAFFGAFLAGLCMPHAYDFQQYVDRLLRPVVRVTLPVFFALTGLRMQGEMFAGGGLVWFATILTIAVVGKIGGSLFAAHGSGMAWRKSAEIGVLMNTRGLVELIVLNVGYKEGILNGALFSMFVLMAIVTTGMTVPLLELVSSE